MNLPYHSSTHARNWPSAPSGYRENLGSLLPNPDPPCRPFQRLPTYDLTCLTHSWASEYSSAFNPFARPLIPREEYVSGGFSFRDPGSLAGHQCICGCEKLPSAPPRRPCFDPTSAGCSGSPAVPEEVKKITADLKKHSCNQNQWKCKAFQPSSNDCQWTRIRRQMRNQKGCRPIGDLGCCRGNKEPKHRLGKNECKPPPIKKAGPEMQNVTVQANALLNNSDFNNNKVWKQSSGTGNEMYARDWDPPPVKANVPYDALKDPKVLFVHEGVIRRSSSWAKIQDDLDATLFGGDTQFLGWKSYRENQRRLEETEKPELYRYQNVGALSQDRKSGFGTVTELGHVPRQNVDAFGGKRRSRYSGYDDLAAAGATERSGRASFGAGPATNIQRAGIPEGGIKSRMWMGMGGAMEGRRMGKLRPLEKVPKLEEPEEKQEEKQEDDKKKKEEEQKMKEREKEWRD